MAQSLEVLPSCKFFTVKKTQKHPHMRGEDDGGGERNSPAMETPPHAWGRR